MRFGDLLAATRRSINGNRLRSNLTVSIITIGIMALIGIITVIQILESTIKYNFSTMGANTFTIQPESFQTDGKKRKKRRKQGAGTNVISYKEAQQFIKNYSYPCTTGLSVLVTRNTTVKTQLKKSNPNIMVMAVDQHYLDISGTLLDAGRNFNAIDVTRNENSCLIGNKIGEDYFGDAQKAVGEYLSVGDTRYRVMGVLESKGSSLINRMDNQVFITINNARQRFNLSNESYWISVKLKDIKYLQLATDEAEGQMRIVRNLKVDEENNFALQTNDALASMLIDNIKDVTLAAALIGLITLLGAAIGLMNIMLVAVAERTREIGVSKAIGANNKTVRQQFLAESVYISVKGGLLGVILGLLLGNIVALIFQSAFVIPYQWIFIGLVTCFVVGILAGIYPAIRASRLNPINALRYE